MFLTIYTAIRIYLLQYNRFLLIPFHLLTHRLLGFPCLGQSANLSSASIPNNHARFLPVFSHRSFNHLAFLSCTHLAAHEVTIERATTIVNTIKSIMACSPNIRLSFSFWLIFRILLCKGGQGLNVGLALALYVPHIIDACLICKVQ